MSGMSGGAAGGGRTTTENSSRDPWGPQQPYIMEMFRRAQAGLDQAPEGYGLNQAAAGQMQKTLNGDYLFGNAESNKAVDAITKASMNRAMPGIDSKFASGGRYGSGLHKAALGQQIADTSSGLMAQNYASERANQMNAGQMAPGIANALDWKQQRLRDFSNMVSGNFGGTQSGSKTEQQNMSRNRWMGALGGAMAGGRTGNPWAAGAGGLIGFLS